jgi:polysaccharide biosynthesis transport protein
MPNEFEDNPDYAVDFKRLFTLLQNWAWFLILVAVLGTVSAFAYSRLQTPVYEATTNILVTRNLQQTVGDFSQTLSLSELVQTYVRRLSLDEFLEIVSQHLGYKVEADNVNVSALTNTQVIQLQVQDVDPARAARIADTMVVVLGAQNETLVAGRYTEAEQSLDLQIKDIEARIATLQAKLDQATAGARTEQITQAQSKIDATVSAIQVTTIALERLDKLSWPEAQALLQDKKTQLPQQQAVLAQQIAENKNLQSKLASDSQAQTDPNYAATLKAQIAAMDAKIETTHRLVDEIQSEIEFFTPLDTEQGYISIRVEKENLLKTQQSLLTAYQNVYSNLMSTADVGTTTNEINNLKQDLELYKSVYLNLLGNREDVKKQKLQNLPTIEQISPALTAKDPVKPRTLLNTILGGLAGLILALTFVILRDMLDDTIKSRDEVEKLLGTKVIGYIADIKDNRDGEGIYVERAPHSSVAEAFRALRTNLEFSSKEKPLKTLIVISGAPAEGKTTIAINLAAILAHSGKKVILVDADLRRPRVHQNIGIPNASGLSDLINADQGASLSAYVQKPEKSPDLDILPSGSIPSNPTDLLGSGKMQNILHTLSDSYDYVVIDCPVMLVADTQVLLGMVDGALLVLVPGKTSHEVVRAVKEQVQHTGVRLLGVVFNRLSHSRQTGQAGFPSNYYFSNASVGDDSMKKKEFWRGRNKGS